MVDTKVTFKEEKESILQVTLRLRHITCFSIPSKRLRSLWKSLKASFTRLSRSTFSLNSNSGFLSRTMDTTISNYGQPERGRKTLILITMKTVSKLLKSNHCKPQEQSIPGWVKSFNTLILFVGADERACLPPLWFVCTRAEQCSSACPPPAGRNSSHTWSCQTTWVAAKRWGYRRWDKCD